MQAIIGTSAIAQTSTTGSGTGATFDLTLTDTGMTAVHNRNEGTSDSVTDQKEVVLQGTVSGADAPYIGFFTYRTDNGGQKRYGIACFGMTAFNSGLALSAQPGIGPLAWTTGSSSGSHILVAEEVAENNLWGIHVDGRCITGFIRGNIATEADSYHTFYVGLGDGFGPTTTSPYPMVIAASSNNHDRRTSDLSSTGLAEAFQDPIGGGPIYYLRKSDKSWQTVRNTITPSSEQNTNVMWPRGLISEASDNEHLFVEDNNWRMLNDGVIGSGIRANVLGKIYPCPGSSPVWTFQPLTIFSSGGSGAQTVNTEPVARLRNCFFGPTVNESGAVHTAEDEVPGETDSDARYIAIPCNTESLANRPYQFMFFRMD